MPVAAVWSAELSLWCHTMMMSHIFVRVAYGPNCNETEEATMSYQLKSIPCVVSGLCLSIKSLEITVKP